MKHTALIAASLAVMALSACKGKDEAATNESSASTAPSDDTAMATASPTNPAQVFADAAASSDNFEIETSKLAATKAASAKVKKFADAMIKDHTESTAKLKTAASAASPAITPSAQLNPDQQKTLDDLSGKTGADFDTAYAKAQVDGHQKTLDALNAYSASGTVPSLKAFATKLIPVVTAHLNMAKGL